MWTEWLSYWDVALAAVGALGLVAAAGLALLGLAGWQRRARRRRLKVELINQGNTRSQYAVWVDNPAGQLAFQLFLNGQAQTLTPAMAGAAPVPPSARPASAGAGRFAGARDWAMSLLGEIGRLLPGQLGASARALDHNLRQTDYTARRVQELASIARPAAGSAGAAETGAAPPPAAVPAARAQTPAIAPGASLVVQLEVTPAAAFTAATRTFQIFSQALDAEAGSAVAEPVQVEFRRVSWLVRWGLPAVIVSGALIGAALCVLYVLSAFGIVF